MRKFIWFWEVPNSADNPPQTNFVDNEGKVKEEGLVRIFGTPTQKFTRKQRMMLNNIKERAEDVKFEEIQG